MKLKNKVFTTYEHLEILNFVLQNSLTNQNKPFCLFVEIKNGNSEFVYFLKFNFQKLFLASHIILSIEFFSKVCIQGLRPQANRHSFFLQGKKEIFDCARTMYCFCLKQRTMSNNIQKIKIASQRTPNQI